MRRLLIIACSQRKHPAPHLLAAIERYDGPAFRVLRKRIAAAPQDAPEVLILSAKYGLIASTDRIPVYDCRMTLALARRMGPAVLAAVRRALESQSWRAVGLCLGRHYRPALDGLTHIVPASVNLTHIGGGLGRRLTNLLAWLRLTSPVHAGGSQ